eukprot:46804-Eustigmatos_ZCMA.PRE.1
MSMIYHKAASTQSTICKHADVHQRREYGKVTIWGIALLRLFQRIMTTDATPCSARECLLLAPVIVPSWAAARHKETERRSTRTGPKESSRRTRRHPR